MQMQSHVIVLDTTGPTTHSIKERNEKIEDFTNRKKKEKSVFAPPVAGDVADNISSYS